LDLLFPLSHFSFIFYIPWSTFFFLF